MTHTLKSRLLSLTGAFLFCSGIAGAQQIPYYNSAELIEKGAAEHDKGNYAQALAWYRKVPEGDTNYLWSVYEQSLTLIADTNYKESLALSQKALKEGYSDKRQLLLNIANATDELGNEQEALKLYDSCAVLYPNDYRPYYERAIIYSKKKDLATAERYLQQSLLRNPYHFRSHYMLGRIYTLEGRLTEAMMALETALVCTNNKEAASAPIELLSALALQTDEVNEIYSNKKPEHAHPLYDEIDEIIHAKLALNKAYALKTDIDDKIVRQTQVMMEKLQYDRQDTTFSMQYYVPLFKDIYNKEQLEAYILLLFSEYGIESIDKLATARKGKAKLQEIRTLVYPYLSTIRSTRVLNYMQRQETPEWYHYFPKDKMMVAGKYADKTNGKFAEGPVKYYKEEALVIEGRYNAKSQKEGTWNHYYLTGKPNLREHYKNGKLNGEVISWHENGNIRSRTDYNDEGVIAERQIYEYNGSLKRAIILTGKNIYREISYHPNGAVKRVLYVTDKKILDGIYTSFNTKGGISDKMTYKDDQLEGAYKIYYESGELKESFFYRSNKTDSIYESFYPDGKPEAKYTYLAGKRQGLCENYYENGEPSIKGNFIAGKEDGETNYYDRTGKKYGSLTYRDGVIIAAKYTDPVGQTLIDVTNSKGISPMTFYNAMGNKRTVVSFDDKGQRQGNAIGYFAVGTVREERGYKDGEQDGPSVSYFQNGKISTRHNYSKGVEDGYYQVYHANGALKTEGWMKNNESQGVWHNYHENGKLSRELFVVDGELNGPEKIYDVNGKLNYINWYDQDMLIKLQQYDSMGKMTRETTFEKGNGAYCTFYPNGNPAMQLNLKYGSFDGPYTIHTPDKKLLEQGSHMNGKREGECTTYHPNGKIRLKGVYKKGQKHGRWTSYGVDGTKESEIDFVEGDQQGDELRYAGGMLRYATPYHRDDRQGGMTIYGEQQKRAAVLYYEMGTLTGYTYEGKDGQLIPIIPVANGTAAIRTFYANGTKALEFNMIKNCDEGSQKLYFSNGQLAEEKTYAEDNYNGISKWYNPDGSKLAEATYQKNMRQGNYREYNTQGKLLFSASFVDGLPNGPAKITDAEGKGMIDLWYYYGTLQ